jgi:hypothetical protein
MNFSIYQITCKNPEIKDVYIGSSKNYISRQYRHKYNCCNIKSPHYNFKLYKFIRDNGGWDNWKMEILENFVNHSLYEAKMLECHYCNNTNSTLNNNSPYGLNVEKRKTYMRTYMKNYKDKKLI